MCYYAPAVPLPRRQSWNPQIMCACVYKCLFFQNILIKSGVRLPETLSPRIKQPDHEAQLSPACSTEGETDWTSPSIRPYAIVAYTQTRFL